MNETVSLVLFCLFMAIFLGLIISNVMLVKQTTRRIALFLATVVLPFIPFLIYYFYKAPGIKETKEVPKDIGVVLLRMDLLTFYLVAVFLIQVAITLLLSLRKWRKSKNTRTNKN